MEEVVRNVRAMALWGVKRVVLTNAAGAVDRSLRVGQLMAIQDHINFLGSNPLTGPNPDDLGPRFPDMTTAYNPQLRAETLEASRALNIDVAEGVYLATTGPTYETPAEVRAFGILGARTVGMSTVPEATLGHALGMRVCGLSCISNKAAGISTEKLKHEDVEEAAKIALPEMKATVLSFLNKLAG